jgi:hypothetical protein
MRVHVYPHKGPKTTGYIVGEKSGLLKLAKSLEAAARGAVGTERLSLYSSDGHEYEMIITRDVTENEWQNIELPNSKNADPSKLESVTTYNDIRKEMEKRIETTDCV